MSKERLAASPPKPGRRQVFWVSWQNRTLALVMLAGAVALVADLLPADFRANGQLRLSAPIVIISSFVAVMIGLILWNAFGTYWVVTPDGLEYHETGLSIVAAWRDVQALKTRREIGGGRGGAWSAEGLVLKQSQLRANPVSARLFRARGGSDFIPLTPFASRWRSTELGALIRRYAPHLHSDFET
jgi:hypothetical protein